MGCCISQRHNEKEDKIENINRQIIINSADLYKETCWKRYSGLHNHDVDQNFDNHSINTKQTSNLDTDTQRIKISIELISFELTYSHYYAKFHQEFEPYFVICHSDTYRVFSEFIKDKKGNFEVNNNSDDESTYTLEDTRTTHKFDDLEYFKKSSTVYISKKLGKFQDKNIFSIEIFPDLNWNNYVSIKLLNHSELDNKLFLIGECKLPIIFLYGRFKKDDWQSYASISIRNSCHNIELGQLNFQIITKHYDKQIKKLGINKDNCMLKLKEFSKLHLLRLEDIPLNVIKQNFVTEDRLLDYGRLKREFSYLIDKITDTINFSKIDDLRQMITRKQFKKVPYDTIRVDHVNYYALMYTINTILDNYNSDKKSLHLFERLTNEFFSHNFIFQYLVEDSGSSNLLLTINFLQIIVNLHKYKLMKSSYLVFSTVNYLIKNFGDIYSSTKCLLPNIINRNRLLAVDDNLKIFIVSDFDYLNIKDFYYNFLSGIRYTYEYYIHLLTNEKSSIDSTTKDFLLQDIITFKQNYKLYFLFTDKFLILDDNIVLSIINIFYCYIKFARLFAQIYNISKLELIQETLLADFKFTNWLYTIFNQYNTEANFNISFLEITYELLKDAGGIFIFNFLKIFDLGFFMINFRNYMISFNKSNYLLWYYQINIYLIISQLIDDDDNQYYDFISLKLNDYYMLSMQVYNIFVRLCRNKSLGPPSLFQPLYFNNLLRAKYINSYTIDKDAEKFLMNTISIKLMNITFKLLNNLLKNNSNFIKIFFSKENKAKKIISTIVCYVLLLVERDLYCFIIKNKLVFKQLYSGILEFLFNLINIQSTSLFIYDYVYISTISIFETIDESWKKKNSLWKNFICNLSEKLKFTSDNYDTDSQMNNRLDYLSNISKKLESNFEELNSDLSY